MEQVRRWNTALYIRLSRDDGRDESMSVTHQRAMLQAFIQGRDDLSVIDCYIDDGHTGTDFERPEFQRMLADIHLGKVDCVLVKDLSRLGRNYIETGNYMETIFPRYHIRFISVADHLDSVERPGDMNSLIVPIKNIINDDYCRQASEKIRAVADMKRRNGEFIGSFAPYGYQKSPQDKHHLIPDPEAAAIIRDIFQQYLEGTSKRGIAEYLNELGIPSPAEYKRRQGLRYQSQGKPVPRGLWSSQTIGGILSNEVYIGNMVQGKYRIVSYKDHRQVQTPKSEWYVVPNTHEEIISREIFDEAQHLLKCGGMRTPPQGKKVCLFSGLLRCGDCGHAMHRKKSGKRVYYICKTYKEYSKTSCSPHTIPHFQLEKAVTGTLWLLCAVFTDRIPNIIPNSTSSTQDEINRLQKQYDEQKLYRKHLYEDWKRGDLSHEDYLFLKEQYIRDEERISNRISALQQTRLKTGKKFNSEDSQWNGKALNRLLVTEFIEHINIFSQKKIQIRFRAADPFLK